MYSFDHIFSPKKTHLLLLLSTFTTYLTFHVFLLKHFKIILYFFNSFLPCTPTVQPTATINNLLLHITGIDDGAKQLNQVIDHHKQCFKSTPRATPTMQWPPQHPMTRLTIEREREREVNAKNLLKKKKIKDLQKAIIIYFERVRMYISFL